MNQENNKDNNKDGSEGISNRKPPSNIFTERPFKEDSPVADSPDSSPIDNSPVSQISRRDFLKAFGLVGVVSAAGLSSWGALELIVESGEVQTWKKSVCRFCGVGCGVMLGMNAKNQIAKIRGDQEASNKGIICIKGSLLANLYRDLPRLSSPQIRKNGQLVKATWKEAFDLIEEKFKAAIRESGPNSVAFYGSGQLETEASYTANKIFKAGIGTNNVDSNARLCMASAAVGYTQVFGKDEPLGSYTDLDHATCYFILGANIHEAHPPLFERIKQRKDNDPNIKVICVDPRLSETAESLADIHIDLTPGTDMLLLNSMAYLIMKNNWADLNFIQEHISFNDGKEKVNLNDYLRFLEDYAPEKTAAEIGVSIDKIKEITYWFSKSSATTSLWTMGANQKTQGVFINNSLMALHLLTKQICKRGATPLSLTGQGNACGGIRDTGSLSHILPNGRLVKNPEHRREMEEIWALPPGTLSAEVGYNAVDLFKAMKDGKVKAGIVMCTNPAQSIPNLKVALEGMKKAFLVVCDIVPTETTKYADVILPTTLWVEREGVKGQTERRYQLMEKVVEPPPNVKSDLEILTELSKRLGLKELITAKTHQEVWDEWRKVSAKSVYNFEGITYERLKKERGLQWPCPDENHPGTSHRYAGKANPLVDNPDPFVSDGKEIEFYAKKDKRAVVFLRPYIASPQKVNQDFPYYLTTGRVKSQWHTGTMTRYIKELENYSGDNKILIHPLDAEKINLQDGDAVKITSEFGEIVDRVQVSPKTKIGTIFSSFYDEKKLINLVVNDAYDNASKEPEFKITRVKLEKV